MTKKAPAARVRLRGSFRRARVARFLLPFPPGRLFHAIPRYRFEIRDARGQSILFHEYLPARTYFLTGTQYPVRLATWLANREPGRAPLDVRVTTLTSTAEKTREYRAVAGQAHADVLSP
jgi:hypothetical protein